MAAEWVSLFCWHALWTFLANNPFLALFQMRARAPRWQAVWCSGQQLRSCNWAGVWVSIRALPLWVPFFSSHCTCLLGFEGDFLSELRKSIWKVLSVSLGVGSGMGLMHPRRGSQRGKLRPKEVKWLESCWPSQNGNPGLPVTVLSSLYSQYFYKKLFLSLWTPLIITTEDTN